jgi:uncharacterized repeat protein (TIGR01451 family)
MSSIIRRLGIEQASEVLRIMRSTFDECRDHLVPPIGALTETIDDFRNAISGGGAFLGTLNSSPNTTFRIELFSNAACDPAGFGEGETFLQSTSVTTDGNGNASFTAITSAVDDGAFISSTATDAENNTSEFSQCVQVARPVPVDADLVLTKADSPDPVTVGQTLTYTLTASNNGPANATGVTVTDTLPSGVTFVSASPSQGNCSGTTTVSCTLGDLNNGSSATVTIQVTPTTEGELSNTASVQGNQPT